MPAYHDTNAFQEVQVTIWWRVKQKGPYTQLGLNHMNPICKIIAFQLKEMLYLQTFALMGQVSKVIDKSLRPKLTEENWWDLFYYSIFTVIHMKQIYKIMQEKTPVQFSLDDLELFDLVFQPNQFSPRQFDALKKLGVVRTARKGDLLAKAGEPMSELLVLIHGQCSVIVNGKVTNIVKPGGFIGELEFLRGEESAGEAATDKAPHFVADAAKHAAPASSLFSLGYLANIWESATRAALSGAEAVGFFSPAKTRESFLAVDRRASEADPHMLSTWRDDGVMGVGIPVATSTSRRDGADGPRKPWHTGNVSSLLLASMLYACQTACLAPNLRQMCGSLPVMRGACSTGAVDITVEASSPVTYLAWRFDVLYHFIQTDKKIALRLEAMLAKDLANKVLQTDTLAKTKGKDKAEVDDGSGGPGGCAAMYRESQKGLKCGKHAVNAV
ncbi:MAG: cyclic nucleotide-binding domain-containing protein, partial [Promethearchaeia archaeon]